MLDERCTGTALLIVEVLVARWRLGESCWHFVATPGVKRALDKLTDIGYVHFKRGDTPERTWRVFPENALLDAYWPDGRPERHQRPATTAERERARQVGIDLANLSAAADVVRMNYLLDQVVGRAGTPTPMKDCAHCHRPWPADCFHGEVCARCCDWKDGHVVVPEVGS